eukprot:6445021-Amphidinium_carterae.1
MEALQSAYRQIPVSDTNLSCCVVMVADPDTNMVRYFVLYGQPFGAAHAVSNFYRVAECHKTLLSHRQRSLLKPPPL